MTTVSAAAGTTEVQVKVTGRSTWSLDVTSENRQRVRTWHAGADCSKYQIIGLTYKRT